MEIKRASFVVTAVCGALWLSGCSTFAVPKYSASPDSVATLRKLQPVKVNLGSFTGEKANAREITCRGVGPVQPPEGQTFGEYLRGALRAELVMADLYDDKSPLRIEGKIQQLDFSSGITDASWMITLTLSSTNGAQMTSATNYRFSGSFYGETACQQTAQAGMGAVQRLMETVVADPNFLKLAQ